MKARMTTSMVGKFHELKSGHVYDLPDAEAAKYIAAGFAVAVAKDDPTPTTPTPDANPQPISKAAPKPPADDKAEQDARTPPADEQAAETPKPTPSAQTPPRGKPAARK